MLGSGGAERKENDSDDDDDGLGFGRAEIPCIGLRWRELGGESEIEGFRDLCICVGFGLKGFWGFRNDFEGDIEIAELCILFLFFSDHGQEREKKGRRERGLGFCGGDF